ncbi:TSUP family transporter [Bartonella sp. DGB2]|uniref:TSUP family transporter n=1 Tax=Bartonella sp. DGB2 TaxID=3388426 RepID=UPI00399038D4
MEITKFISQDPIIILAFIAFFAGAIDSIAGGGGLITIPALILSGMPPLTVLGTNKLQSLFGSFSATIAYAHAGHVRIQQQLFTAIMAFIGSILGALIATRLPSTFLQAILPILLLLIAGYFTLKPQLDDKSKVQRLKPFIFSLIIAPLIGLYDGLFGPGTGSFYMLAFVSLVGHGILRATAHTKLLNFASNLGGFITFAMIGIIDFRIGIVMGIAQFLGAQCGARLAMYVGARLIKPILVITCIILATKLLWDPQNPLQQFYAKTLG